MSDKSGFTDLQLMQEALKEARKSVDDGGMPFGAALVVDGKLVARGHNRQIQDGDFLAHAEMVCLGDYLKTHPGPLKGATLAATESPCPMCAGAAIVAGVSRIIVGERHHYAGACDWLSQQDVDLVILDDPECIALVSGFKSDHLERWNKFSAG